jgi:biotin carboxyl carrier protein
VSEANVFSEITGIVTQVLFCVGENIKRGDIVFIIEAMKMEVPVVALHDGSLEALLVEAGSSVAEGEALAIIVPQMCN